MFRQQSYIIANILMVLDALILITAGSIAYFSTLEIQQGSLVMAWNDFIGCMLFMMFANNYLMGRLGFYSERRFPSSWSMIRALFMAVLLSFAMLSAGAILIGIRPFSRVFILIYFLMALLSLTITRVIFYYYLDQRNRTTFNSHQILLAGTRERIEAVAKVLDKQRSWGHRVAGCLNVNGDCNSQDNNIPILGNLDEFDRVLFDHRIDEVIFALPKGSPVDLSKYMNKCEEIGVAVRIVPAMLDFDQPMMRVDSIQNIPTLTYYTNGTRSASGLLYKRILDLFAGFFGYLVFLILYPIVGLAIKLDSPGPILFKQRRAGLHGRQFDLYKFRSMTADAETKQKDFLLNKDSPWPIYNSEQDPRITRVGRFLRKTSLDELPQIINVLKGEMSIVGTRPPTIGEVKQYADWHRKRISIKPGITGLWQISGRKEIKDFTEVVNLDLQYINHWRFSRDLVILCKTVWVVLVRKGAK